MRGYESLCGYEETLESDPEIEILCKLLVPGDTKESCDEKVEISIHCSESLKEKTNVFERRKNLGREIKSERVQLKQQEEILERERAELKSVKKAIKQIDCPKLREDRQEVIKEFEKATKVLRERFKNELGNRDYFCLDGIINSCKRVPESRRQLELSSENIERRINQSESNIRQKEELIEALDAELAELNK